MLPRRMIVARAIFSIERQPHLISIKGLLAHARGVQDLWLIELELEKSRLSSGE
jgi:hypothetical protein